MVPSIASALRLLDLLLGDLLSEAGEA